MKQQLLEAITSFQSDSSYREKCYQQLQIEQPFCIIDGLDLLAENLGLEVTERTFVETNFLIWSKSFLQTI